MKLKRKKRSSKTPLPAATLPTVTPTALEDMLAEPLFTDGDIVDVAEL